MEESTTPEKQAAAESAVNKLPPKSKPIYDKEYIIFKKWCTERKYVHRTENVLLRYYNEMACSKKASTLWASYSMLRACLNTYENIDITKFTRLQAFLKRQSDGYQPKKSKMLQQDEINRFINESDDLNYLGIKVILIMGYCGALRRDEFIKMVIDDVKLKDDVICVSVNKTKPPRIFMISDANYIQLIKKYVSLRPEGAPRRFFLTYRNGHCVRSPIGINKIGEIPRLIASYLKLSNPELYTGHCFRRSGASHLANQGGDLITIKRRGGWKSSAVAEDCVEDFLLKKKAVADMFTSLQESTSNSLECSSTSSLNPSETSLSSNGDDEVNQVNLHGTTNFEQNFDQNCSGISFQTHDCHKGIINNYYNCIFYGETSKTD